MAGRPRLGARESWGQSLTPHLALKPWASFLNSLSPQLVLMCEMRMIKPTSGDLVRLTQNSGCAQKLGVPFRPPVFPGETESRLPGRQAGLSADRCPW